MKTTDMVKLVLVAFVLVALVALATGPVFEMGTAQAEGDPQPGTVTNKTTVTLYPSTLITDTTVYSSLNTETGYWNYADIFIYADLNATSYVTVTAQMSPDGTYYADADYVTEDDDAVTTYTHSYVRSLVADGTEYMRVPLAGEYFRCKILITGSGSPEIMATLRNN